MDAMLAEKTEKRCQNVALAAGWLHPFFLVPLSYVKWEITDAIPTLAVTPDPIIRVNPHFVAKLPDRTLAGCIYHEILHPMLAHAHRQGGRDGKAWNVATDMAINSMLARLGLPLPDGVFYAPHGMEEASSEEIYSRNAQDGRAPQGNPGQLGQGCGMAPKVGKGEGQEAPQAVQEGQEGEKGDAGPGEEGNPAQGEGAGQDAGSGWVEGEGQDSDRFWGEIIAQAQTMARGTTSAQVMAKALAPAPVKVRWAQILRATINRVAASGGRDLQSFARRSRRSPPGVVLPGWQTHRPTVAVVIDTSGSVSDAMLEEAIGNTVQIAVACGARIFLALHDSVCYWHAWIDAQRPEKINRLTTRRGGTCARQAYALVGHERARFDALIHLTDGELDWPQVPANCRRLVAAMLGDADAAIRWCGPPPAGALVIKASV